MEKAAELRDSVGLVNLGNSYYKGECGYRQDHKKALECYNKAAAEKPPLPRAFTCISTLQAAGHTRADGRPDYKAAFKNAEVAAKLGCVMGNAVVAEYYKRGREVPRDLKKARGYWQRAAIQGHPESMFELGKLYEFGTGVKRDRQQAYKYVAMSAMQGFEAAIGAMASGLPATELTPLRG